MTPGFLDWTVEVDGYQLPIWETKRELRFGRKIIVHFLIYWGWDDSACPGGWGCSQDQAEAHFRLTVIFLFGTDEDLHWENKEFGLEYARGRKLKLKSKMYSNKI